MGKLGFRTRIVYIAVGLMVYLCSGSALQTINTSLINLLYILAAGILFYAFAYNKAFDVGVDFVSLIIFVGMVCVTAQTDINRQLKAYLNFFCYPFIGYGIAHCVKRKQVAKYYVKVMEYVTIVGLLGYVIANNTTFLTMLSRKTNVNGVVYRIGYIFNYIESLPERNCAIFWEPGLFATYLTWAMMADVLIVNDQYTLRRFVIFSLGIITAHSSAGYLLWIACIILYVMKNTYEKNNSFSYSLFGGVIIFLAIFALLNMDALIDSLGLTGNEYIAKLQTDRIAKSARALSVTHNMEGFLASPLIGNGVYEVKSLAVSYSDTSTSTYMLNAFGISGAFYTIAWAIAVFKQKPIHLYSKMVVMAIILSIINKEPHATILFTWIVLFVLLRTEQEEPAKINTQNVLDTGI